MKKMTVFEMCMTAFFAALTAILTQIAIPIGPVPITLGTFSVFLAGALLGAKLGAVSQAVYVLLGVFGVPVFSSLRAGVGVLIGPTGGYIAGYILAAGLVGFFVKRYGNKFCVIILAMLAGYCAYTFTGSCWYMYSMETGVAEALMVCVVPFIPGDVLKIVLATILAQRLNPVLQKYLK